MNRSASRLLAAGLLILCCSVASSHACNFGSSDGWNGIVEKVEWEDMPFSNAVVAISGFIAESGPAGNSAVVQVVSERNGTTEPVPLDSPLFPKSTITVNLRRVGIGCAVKYIAELCNLRVQSTKQGPVFIVSEPDAGHVTPDFDSQVDRTPVPQAAPGSGVGRTCVFPSFRSPRQESKPGSSDVDTTEQRIRRSMSDIVITNVDLRNATVPDAVSFLISAGKTYDKEHRGISMVCMHAPDNRTITIGAKSMTFLALLDELCRQGNMSWSVTPNGLVVSHENAQTD